LVIPYNAVFGSYRGLYFETIKVTGNGLRGLFGANRAAVGCLWDKRRSYGMDA